MKIIVSVNDRIIAVVINGKKDSVMQKYQKLYPNDRVDLVLLHDN